MSLNHFEKYTSDKEQVYSCEYQMTAVDYFDGLNLVQNNVVPFYPPPDDATDGACCEFEI